MEAFKAEIVASENKNKSIGAIFLAVFLSIFIGVGGFVFVKSYQQVVKIFRKIFIGKLGFLNGLFMVSFSLLPLLFGLVFITMPLVFAAAFSASEFGFDFEIKKIRVFVRLTAAIIMAFSTFFRNSDINSTD